MKKVILIELTSCRECHYSTNSSKEHDCAFTSAPLHTLWWCTKGEGKFKGDTLYINNPNEISKYCPF